MVYSYEGLTSECARVRLGTYITFEGNPVMRVEDFHDIKKMGTVNPFLVRVTIEYPDTRGKNNRKPIPNKKADLWLHPSEIKTLINNFNLYGAKYFYHLKFETVI